MIAANTGATELHERYLRLLRNKACPGALCLLCVLILACGGSEPGVVRGVVVEAIDRNLAEIETLRIRDGSGRVWVFTTVGALEKNGAHLRLHQVIGEAIEVSYEERNGQLIATALRD